MQEVNQKLIFVTGKGGVGKSTLAAAIAAQIAKTDSDRSEGEKSVLLAEIGDQSYFQELFHFGKDLGYQPEEISAQKIPGLFASLWSGQDCLKEYAKHLLKLDSLYRLFFENAIMKTFIQIAPGLPELAIMGKMTSGVRKHGPAMPFQTVVMDSFATGHFISLMKAPSAMAKTIQFGPMGEQSRSIDVVLKNPQICEYVVVCLPEELPVREAIELCQQIKDQVGFEPRVILNRCLSGNESAEEIERFANKFPKARDFADYLLIQKKTQEDALERLRQVVSRVDQIPFIFDINTEALVQKIAVKLPEMTT